MAKHTFTAIRFLRGWQGRERGFTERHLPPGVMQTLVQHNIAEFVELTAQRDVRGKRRTRKRTDHSSGDEGSSADHDV